MHERIMSECASEAEQRHLTIGDLRPGEPFVFMPPNDPRLVRIATVRPVDSDRIGYQSIGESAREYAALNVRVRRVWVKILWRTDGPFEEKA